MLYQIGTANELPMVESQFPDDVVTEILLGLVVLDAEYGTERDYLTTGGYSVIAQTLEDVSELKRIFNYEKHQCEWVTRIGNTGYISALFIINNDFSVMAYMPEKIAPNIILENMED